MSELIGKNQVKTLSFLLGKMLLFFCNIDLQCLHDVSGTILTMAGDY